MGYHMTDRKELAERLIDALSRIASKNDLAGIPAEQCPTAAYNALYECEIIARDALATVPAHIGDERALPSEEEIAQTLAKVRMKSDGCTSLPCEWGDPRCCCQWHTVDEARAILRLLTGGERA